MSSLSCPGVVQTGAGGEALCLDELSEVVEWVVEPDVQVNPSLAAEAFGVGFLLMASCWAMGKGVALVISLVRR